MALTVFKIQKEIRFRIHGLKKGVSPPAILPQRIVKEITTLKSLLTWIESMKKFDPLNNPPLEMTSEESGRVGGLIGGRSKSAAKAEAARVNGLKGGRPKKKS